MEHPQGVAVVRAPRDLRADVGILTDQLNALLDAGSCWIVLDLSDAPHVGTLAFGTIALAARKAREGGGRLHLARVPRGLGLLFEHAGLTQVAPQFPTVSNAIAAFDTDEDGPEVTESR